MMEESIGGNEREDRKRLYVRRRRKKNWARREAWRPCKRDKRSVTSHRGQIGQPRGHTMIGQRKIKKNTDPSQLRYASQRQKKGALEISTIIQYKRGDEGKGGDLL